MMKTTVLIALTVLILTLMTGSVLAAGDAAAGKEVFAKKCGSCHGPSGEGKDTIAKMLKIEMRPLGSKEVQARSDDDIIKVVKEGNGKMNRVAGLSDKDTQAVHRFHLAIAFLHHFDN